MLESLINLHCKMQSRIRKARVRQGLGEDRLGLLSMTNPIRVIIWSLMLLCENLGSRTHEGHLPVTAQHLQEHQICLAERTKCDLICGMAKGLSLLLGGFCHRHMGITQRTALSPSQSMSRESAQGLDHKQFLLYLSAFPCLLHSQSAEVAPKHTDERESKIRLRTNTNNSVVSNHFWPERRTCFLCSLPNFELSFNNLLWCFINVTKSSPFMQIGNEI